jgi:glycosyltransferase involved in cell wall biosynthesis
MTKISIVIPTWNRWEFLWQTLQSILSQSVLPHEIVIADDGSTDATHKNCVDLVNSLPPTAPRIILSRTEANHGAQIARNRGYRDSKGEYVIFVDSDDVFEPGAIAAITGACAAGNWDYVFGKVVKTDSTLNPLAGAVIGAPFETRGRDIAGYHWHTMGAAYRRTFLDRVGPWNEDLTGSQDWEFQVRVKLAGGKWQFIDQVIGRWRQHTGPRVGARAFNPDYVRSVGKACLLVRDAAVRCGRLDDTLKTLLVRKLIIHAAEFGANGFSKERKRFLDDAISLAPTRTSRSLVKLLRTAPSLLDPALFAALAYANKIRASRT